MRNLNGNFGQVPHALTRRVSRLLSTHQISYKESTLIYILATYTVARKVGEVPEGCVSLSYNRLAQELGKEHSNNVARNLKRLIDCNLIEVVGKTQSGTNIYRVICDDKIS